MSHRAHEALEKAGFGWADAHFDGRDGVITGQAIDDAEPTHAADEVDKIFGVRVVDARASLLDKVDVYKWGAALKDGAVRVTGYAPDAAARRKILDMVKGSFPNAAVDDGMKLARGAPARDAWLGGVGFALKQLTGLKHGHAELTGMDVAIAGEAADAGSFDAVETALGHLPQGMKLLENKVSAPAVSPYAWDAKWSGREVALGGYVPSVAARTALLGKAKAMFGGAPVSDHMHYGAGVPEGFEAAAAVALEQLATLKAGQADLVEHDIALTGETADESAADAVRHALKRGLPGRFRLADQLTWPQPVATEPPVDDSAARRAAEAEAEAEATRRAEAAEARRRAEVAEATRRAEAAEATRRAEIESRNQIALAEVRRCQTELNSILQAQKILFETASATIEDSSLPALDHLAQVAATCPALRIEVAGHTDSDGEPERNRRLSERRAAAVASYLEKSGVANSRLKAVGFGESAPVAPNDTPENKALNRRIEFIVKSSEP